MNILNKVTLSLIVLLSGCTLGENLENRYTKEVPVPAQVRNSDICISTPLQSDETVVSAITYNKDKPSEQVIFPSDKQPESGLYCIKHDEFKFEVGNKYIAYVEVNIKSGGDDKKDTRKSYVSNFKVLQKNNSLEIVNEAY